MSLLLATLVKILHILFIAFMIYAPFSKIDEFLVMHAFLVPFLVMHWLTSTDGCALTILEKRLRGLEHDTESFMHALVAPIYVIDDATLRSTVMLITLGLWTVTLRQLDVATVKRVLLGPM